MGKLGGLLPNVIHPPVCRRLYTLYRHRLSPTGARARGYTARARSPVGYERRARVRERGRRVGGAPRSGWAPAGGSNLGVA